MQQRHIDRYSYFNELAITSRDFYIDYLEKFVAIKRGMNILEIGCGEGGNLLPFAEKECNVTGIDRSEERISQAISYFNLLGFNGRFIHSDFFDFSSEEDMNKYDIILIHDVIEHIDKCRKVEFILHAKEFLSETGIIFWDFLLGKCRLVDINKYAVMDFVLKCHLFIFYLYLCTIKFYLFLVKMIHVLKNC
mgnify:CR=1 FL=1